MKGRDSLGDRMKEQYENRTRYMLPRRTYTIIRVDGKAFHTHLAKAQRPFDESVSYAMARTAEALVKEIQGATLAYTQSDEISVLVGDFTSITSDAWFDGNLQKICSVTASIATATFNRHYYHPAKRLALFDSRVFIIPDPIEVENYFIWRQQDASRNSVSMVAQSLYSHKELHGKGVPQMMDMMHAKGVNWDAYPTPCKRGSCVYIHDLFGLILDNDIPVFTQDRKYLTGKFPVRND